MRFPPNPRRSLPALAVTALFHVAAVIALLHAISTEPVPPAAFPRETQITLFPVVTPPVPDKKHARRSTAGGSNAITTYFNPYAVPQFAPQTRIAGLQTALMACAPEKYDMASAEVRDICGRIGALLQYDPGHFGVKQDVADPKHWQRELARREAPFLAPCMSPYGFSPLYTLLCVYDTLVHGYDPEKRARYSE